MRQRPAGILTAWRCGIFSTPQDASQVKAQSAVADVLVSISIFIDKVMAVKKIDQPEDVRKLAELSPSECGNCSRRSASEIQPPGPKLDERLIKTHASKLARNLENVIRLKLSIPRFYAIRKMSCRILDRFARCLKRARFQFTDYQIDAHVQRSVSPAIQRRSPGCKGAAKGCPTHLQVAQLTAG